jgi:hypothetical protein
MDHADFVRLHAECEKSLRAWITEATLTCKMLGECLNQPLTLEQRSELHRQRGRENEAQELHMMHRRQLFELARWGYGDSELLYGPLPDN